MKKSSENLLTFGLFILGIYGVPLFEKVHALLAATPSSLFGNIGVLMLAFYLIFIR